MWWQGRLRDVRNLSSLNRKASWQCSPTITVLFESRATFEICLVSGELANFFSLGSSVRVPLGHLL